MSKYKCSYGNNCECKTDKEKSTCDLSYIKEKKDSYGYVYKVKYSYPDNPVEWVGFDYVKFDGINNFEPKIPPSKRITIRD